MLLVTNPAHFFFCYFITLTILGEDANYGMPLMHGWIQLAHVSIKWLNFLTS
jgi:hypothetical protein